MQELHIITPIYRPGHVNAIYASIEKACKKWKISWWPVFDQTCAQCAEPFQRLFITKKNPNLFIHCQVSDEADNEGFLHKNHVLELLDNPENDDVKRNEWVYFMDDVTILHPALPKFLNSAQVNDDVDGIVFNRLSVKATDKFLPDMCMRICTLKGQRISLSMLLFYSAWRERVKNIKETSEILSYYKHLV